LADQISSSTVKRFIEKSALKKEKGQTISKARLRESNVRNMISMAVLNEASASNKPPQLVGNFDATQFIVTDTNQELLVTIKMNDDTSENEPLTLVEDSTLSRGIKWMMLCNANGNLGKSVFLVEDSSLKDGDFTKDCIRGLAPGTDPKSDGWLCFTKTRAGNNEFFKWYITEIMVSFVQECRG
jgi:hypothetical protein